jgi:hypothetical protein
LESYTAIGQKGTVSKVRFLYCAEGDFPAVDSVHFVLLKLFKMSVKTIIFSFSAT